MTELCYHLLSAMSKIQLFFILVFTDLYIFTSFILSQPLIYLSYFLFFSPYLFKLLCFLSPVFLTTSLLLLSLFVNEYSEFPTLNDMGFLTSAYHAILNTLKNYHIAADLGHQMEYIRFEDSQVFKIVFDIPMLINNVEDANEEEMFFQALEDAEEDGSSELSDSTCCSTSEEQEIDTKDKKSSFVRNGSKKEQESNKVIQNKVESSRTMNNYSIGSYGSMRKQDREWKRTLACKLFEERHNVVGGSNRLGGGEGMDMLWETYEVESSKKMKNPKSRNYDKLQTKQQEVEEELEDESNGNGQLCCLQAFKFSAGKKMSLGMRKPSLVKITKAIKGLGWLHHQVTNSSSSSRRSSKKVHNGE